MTNCCVYGCRKRGGHLFPKCPRMKRLWEHAVRRKNWKPSATSVVCKDHFSSDAYVIESFRTGLNLTLRKLKSDAVPTLFTWNTECSSVVSSREARLKSRKKENKPLIAVQEYEETNIVHHTGAVGQDITITDCDAILTRDSVEANNVKQFKDMGTQTSCEEPTFSISKFIDNPEAIHFFTGLENYSKFKFVLQTLGPAAHQLNYYRSQVLNLSVENQFFLCLIKLRQNKQMYELSLLFEVSQNTASNIFVTWIKFMALQWGELNIWPSAELVKYYMPTDFKRKFPTTRVIIDCTEFPIEKPTEPNAQQVTFSTYKNRNTLKVLVGATPGGLISYCSEVYGGSASDRQIVERGNLIDMCSQGDSIMADRGFNVQDLFAAKDITINIPSFLKGKSQLSGLTVVHDRKIASKRVHIERIIGLTKTYRILKQELNTHFVHLGNDIYFVCAMLCNFREGIVSKKA